MEKCAACLGRILGSLQRYRQNMFYFVYKSLWRQGTQFEMMTGCTAPSSDGLLAEVFWSFLSRKANARKSLHSPRDHLLPPLTLTTDEASSLWLGTPTGAGGTVTLVKNFFGRIPWLHGQQAYNV